MVHAALFVRLETKPGKEEDVASFLWRAAVAVQEEPVTTAWFAIRVDPSTFAISDAFPDEASRVYHLAGRIAAALTEKAPELFATPVVIEEFDVIAFRCPESPVHRIAGAE